MTEHRDSQAGFALVTVLWSVILISILVILILRSGTGDGLALIYDQQERQARARALGEVNQVMAHLVAGNALPLTEEFTVSHDADELFHSALLFPEAARLDINRAEEPLIRAVLEESGLSQNEARETAEKIVRYRTTVAPFQDVRELVYLNFVTADTFLSLAPVITRYGGTVIDSRHMPKLLQRTMRRLKPSERQAFFQSAEEDEQALAPGNYRLDQTIKIADKREFHYHTIIRFRPGFDTPTEIIEHRPGTGRSSDIN